MIIVSSFHSTPLHFHPRTMTQTESITTVDISNNANVQGVLLEGGLREFHIPYATVPKRWRKAVPSPLWEGTLDGRQQR